MKFFILPLKELAITAFNKLFSSITPIIFLLLSSTSNLSKLFSFINLKAKSQLLSLLILGIVPELIGYEIISVKSFLLFFKYNPSLICQLLLYTFLKYLSPASQTKVTTFFFTFCALQYLIAAAINVPEDDPAKIPSFCNKILHVFTASLSDIV